MKRTRGALQKASMCGWSNGQVGGWGGGGGGGLEEPMTSPRNLLRGNAGRERGAVTVSQGTWGVMATSGRMK